jgi:hypothetical protein
VSVLTYYPATDIAFFNKFHSWQKPTSCDYSFNLVMLLLTSPVEPVFTVYVIVYISTCIWHSKMNGRQFAYQPKWNSLVQDICDWTVTESLNFICLNPDSITKSLSDACYIWSDIYCDHAALKYCVYTVLCLSTILWTTMLVCLTAVTTLRWSALSPKLLARTAACMVMHTSKAWPVHWFTVRSVTWMPGSIISLSSDTLVLAGRM